MHLFLTLAIVFAGLIRNALSKTPSAEIDAGTLKGGTCDNNDDTVYFFSIPFAQPPTDDLRFAAPEAYNDTYSGGELDATATSPSCIQFGSDMTEAGGTSEDCLYLNIWAPSNATDSSALPVRVWIYGGSNTGGGISAPLYDGCAVPDTGAIMVSINYRLGPLGFLTLTEAGIGGNMGIQDVLLGLQWVQDNIDAFGGDPDKVMLHGQSAGAVDVYAIATLPQAPKLMSAAVFQSGGGRDYRLKHLLEFVSQNYTNSLDCSTSDISACLQTKTVDHLQEAYNDLSILHTDTLGGVGISDINGYAFAPCVDGEIIATQPSDRGTQVPAIFGSNSKEGNWFAMAEFYSNDKIDASKSDYETYLIENFGDFSPLVEAVYPYSAFKSTSDPAYYAISQMLTDAAYFCPAYRGLNKAAANGIPVWAYYFGHDPNCTWQDSVPQSEVALLGAAHSAEIPFVLGQTDKLPWPDGSCEMTHAEKEISAFLSSAWTSMAERQLPVLASDESSWPQYQNASMPYGVNITNSTDAVQLDYSRCDVWDSINTYMRELAENGTLAGTNASFTVTASTTGGSSTTGTSSGSTGTSSSKSGAEVLHAHGQSFIIVLGTMFALAIL